MGKGSRKDQLLLFFLLLMVSYSLPNIRAGISQLNMPKTTQANFTLNFNTALPDNVYNQMTTVGYVYDFTPLNGIFVNASCPSANSTQTNLRCMVKALNNNSNNIVFLTYVVSDEINFLCGTYSQDFLFNSATTDLVTNISIFVPGNGKDFVFSDARYINFLPYISGVSSADSDFSLTFGEENEFNSRTQKLNLQIIINEIHTRNVTITFGFLVFDSSKYKISVFENLIFNPTDIKKDLLFGIGQVKSSSTLSTTKIATPIAPKAPGRLLPALPVAPVQKSFVDVLINGTTASVVDSLRNFNLGSKNITVKPTTVNIFAFDQVSQKDGVLASPTMQTFMAIKNMDTQRNSVTGTNFLGQDNLVYNRYFSTNGFVILNAESSVDQVYYFEIQNMALIDGPTISKMGISTVTSSSITVPTVEQDLAPTSKTIISSPNPTNPPVLFKSVLLYNGDPVEPTCNGFVFKVLQQVDYLQKSFIYTCIKCKAGQFLNFGKKKCEKFPVVEAYNNTNDIIV